MSHSSPKRKRGDDNVEFSKPLLVKREANHEYQGTDTYSTDPYTNPFSRVMNGDWSGKVPQIMQSLFDTKVVQSNEYPIQSSLSNMISNLQDMFSLDSTSCVLLTFRESNATTKKDSYLLVLKPEEDYEYVIKMDTANENSKWRSKRKIEDVLSWKLDDLGKYASCEIIKYKQEGDSKSEEIIYLNHNIKNSPKGNQDVTSEQIEEKIDEQEAEDSKPQEDEEEVLRINKKPRKAPVSRKKKSTAQED